jgi:hypothetical protein
MAVSAQWEPPKKAREAPVAKPAPPSRQAAPASPVPAPAVALPQAPSVPSPETLLALVCTNLLALDHAPRTNNFSVLHALAGPHLRTRLTIEGLALLRAQRPDLAVVAIATPILSEQPQIAPNGMLRLVGAFPVQPQQIRFEMIFEAFGGEWRLAGMNVAAVRV